MNDKVNILLKDLQSTYTQCMAIAEAKNADYAGGDNPFKNFKNSQAVGVKPTKAIMVRMMDKMSRVTPYWKLERHR